VNGKRETQPRGNCRETSAGRGAEVEGQDLRRSCPIDRCLGSNLSPLASRVRRVDPNPWTKSRLCRKTTRYLVEGEVSDVRGRERYERGEGEKAGYRNGYRPRQREDGGRRGGIFGAARSRTRMPSPSFGGKDRPAAIDYMLTRWPTPKCSKRLPTRTSSKAPPRCKNGWVRTSIRTPSTPSRSKPTSPLSPNAEVENFREEAETRLIRGPRRRVTPNVKLIALQNHSCEWNRPEAAL
jgi:hypothetical protein